MERTQEGRKMETELIAGLHEEWKLAMRAGRAEDAGRIAARIWEIRRSSAKVRAARTTTRLALASVLR
jgi:hypothetical protein